jgi:Type I restriction enzyme R protein N terminus (HSDR_N)
MDKRVLSERDICTKFITPALRNAGWDEMLQIREEVSFTKGRIIVRGKLVSRGRAKRADYVLYFKPNIPLALIEAKDNSHSVGDGMQQGLDYLSNAPPPLVVRLAGCSQEGDAMQTEDIGLRVDGRKKWSGGIFMDRLSDQLADCPLSWPQGPHIRIVR